MRQTTVLMKFLSVVSLILIMTGCPGVSFYIEPETVTFGDNSDRETIRIVYSRGGNWSWEAETTNIWLKLSKDGGLTNSSKIDGSTSGEMIQQLDLVADRSNLPEGTSVGEVTIKSEGETKVVTVSITKPASTNVSASPLSLDFGTITTELQVNLINQSTIKTDWSMAIPSDAAWLTATPTDGVVSAKQSIKLTFTANRSGLAAGIYQTTVKITAGSQEISIPVTMEVSSLKVSPSEIQFGLVEQETQQTLQVSNLGATEISIRMQVSSEAEAWLSVQNPQFVVPASQSVEVPVIVNPTGLAANDYVGTLQVQNVSTNYTVPVTVRMRTRGLTISPPAIDFGKIEQRQTSNFTITNAAPVSWKWTSSIPDNTNWLRITPGSGNIDAGGSQVVAVEADPTILKPGNYQGSIEINSNWGSATLNVQMGALRAPKLVVLPTQINFGETRSKETLAIWNDGEKTIAWEIDTTNLPAWLSITPVDNQGIASGQVSGTQTATLEVKIDRDLANEAEGPSYQHQFEVKGKVIETSTDLAPVSVGVSMSVPQIPEISIVGEGVDNNNIPYINFSFEEIEQEFIVRNSGKGTLEWSVVKTDLPVWITSINPEQGSLGKDKEQKVKVTISRDTLTYLGDSYKIIIKSNDVNQPEVAIIIEVQVPRKAIISAEPTALNFGENGILNEFELANTGDPETVLNFMLIPNKEWISVSPESGISIGTESAIKDWKTISVSIDREGLEGINSSGQIRIVATKLVNGQNIIDTAVAPVLITITAAASPLSIEVPPPNLRIPSLVRYVMLFRDIQQQSISFPEAFLPTLTDKFLITEDDLPLELSESNRFLVPLIEPGKLVQSKGSILIMLDASGSMLKSVQLMGETGISDATDPIRELYVRTVMPMIDEIPDNYKIAIGVFNEREWFNNPVRILMNNDGEPEFTFNKGVAKNRLLSMNIIDHGATALLPAISDGAFDLFLTDGDNIPYDISDDRIMLIITDGRMTTPPGEIAPVVDLLKGARARPFFVSWGENVNKNVMIQLIEETGGHVYSTRNQDTGQVDSLGRPISKPLLSTLADWLQTNPDDPCDRSIAKDIKSQLLFEFIALNQNSGATVRIDVDFDSPADGNSCIPDQGNISTAFAHSEMDLESYANDVRLGQIKLVSSGINVVSQSVDVIVYADYIPRNITALSFSIETSDGNPAMTMSVRQPTFAEGGLIPDWNLVQQGSLLQFTAANNQPLPYGAFGSICVLHFENASQPFKLHFDVVNPQISADPDSKYFTHPNLFDVEVNPSIVLSNPYPYLESEPAMDDNSIIVLPNYVYDLVVDIYNKGGSHRPTDVGLYWDVEVFTGDFFGDIVKPPDEERIVFENETPYKLHIPINREELEPGNNYLGILQFSFDSIFHNAIVRYVTVYCNIQPPEITVVPTELTFDSPDEIEEKSFIIRNTGQSILSWTLDRRNIPGYSFSKYAGSLGPYDSPYNLNKEDYITITVDKTLIEDFAPIIPISSNAVNGTVNLQLIVSSP